MSRTRDALGEQLRREHRHLRAGHHRLDHILGGVDAAGEREVGLDAAVQDRDPAQRQPQLGAVLSVRLGTTSGFQVEVGLVEAVEQHQPVRPGLDRRRAMCGSAVKNGLSLSASGIDTARPDLLHQLDVAILQLGAAEDSGSVGR